MKNESKLSNSFSLTEELSLFVTAVFIIPSVIFLIVGFVIVGNNPGEAFDWSFFAFLLSTGLAMIEFICSLIRVVTFFDNNLPLEKMFSHFVGELLP